SRTVVLESGDESVQLLGKYDQHFALVESEFPVRLLPRGHELAIEGPPEAVEPVYRMFQVLLSHIRKGHILTGSEFEYALKLTRDGNGEALKELFSDLVLITHRGKRIKPKTFGQKRYLEAMR